MLSPHERRLLLSDEAEACVVRLFPIYRSGSWHGHDDSSRLLCCAVCTTLNRFGFRLIIFMNAFNGRIRFWPVALDDVTPSAVRFRLRHEMRVLVGQRVIDMVWNLMVLLRCLIPKKFAVAGVLAVANGVV